jgi:hypothetical protein
VHRRRGRDWKKKDLKTRGKKEQNRGIEPKIIGGTEKENPAHRGRKAGGFEGETEEKLKLNLDKKNRTRKEKKPRKTEEKQRKRKPHT